MAHAPASQALIRAGSIGRTGYWHATISETEAGAATEIEITGVPPIGRIIRHTAVLTAGSGTTIDPKIGTATGVSGVTVRLENDTAAATVDNQPVGGAAYYAPGGSLFLRSICDAGADNAVSHVLLIAEGW